MKKTSNFLSSSITFTSFLCTEFVFFLVLVKKFLISVAPLLSFGNGKGEPLMERVSLSSDDVLVSSAEIKENGYERVERENDDEDDEIWDNPNGDFPGKNIFDILDDELDD